MTESVARLLFPFSLAVAVALWAKGYTGVGDGFSGGAVAGLGAIVQYVCLDVDHARRVVGARWAWAFLVTGLVVVVAIVLAPILVGAPPVTHLPRPGAPVLELGLLKLHTTLAFDLGVGLLVYGALVGTFDRIFPPFRGDEP